MGSSIARRTLEVRAMACNAALSGRTFSSIGLGLLGSASLLAGSAAGQQQAPPLPYSWYSQGPDEVTFTVTGPAETVFDHDGTGPDGGDVFLQAGQVVIPDLPTRAFVDDEGRINLSISAPGKPLGLDPIQNDGGCIRMIGEDFDSLEVDPRFTLQSDMDPARCHFNDAEWLASFYNLDGVVYAIVHMEMETFTHSSEPTCGGEDYCDSPPTCCNGAGGGNDVILCQITNLTAAVSFDGGATFLQHDDFGADHPRLVAHSAYVYDNDVATLGVQARFPLRGHTVPSNIIQVGTYYYMTVRQQTAPRLWFEHPTESWAYPTLVGGLVGTHPHTILMRTDDLSKPENWRAYGGHVNGVPTFTRVVNRDPYEDGEDRPLQHTGHPLDPDWFVSPDNLEAGFMSASLTWNTYLERFVLLDETAVDTLNGPVRAVAFSYSTDLFDWSKPILLDGFPQVPITDWPLYATLIDHEAGGNFETSGQDVYVYFTDDQSAPGSFSLDLARIPVRFQKPANWP